MGQQGEDRSRATTRAPSLQPAESTQPAPAQPVSHHDLRLGARRPEQLAGHPPTVSHALAPAPMTRLACPTVPTIGGDKASDISEGHGDRVRFTSR